MDIYWIYGFGLLFFLQVTSLPEEFNTEVQGYGNTHDTVMRPRCDYPTVMAVRNMHVTSKKISLGCPVSIQADTVYDPICTQVQEGDCTLDFDLTKREPYLECTGVIECDVGTDWQQVKSTCGSSYMTDSHIMSMDFNCIRSDAILKFNEVKVGTSLTETYISNKEFPAAMTSSSGGTCLISSCSTGIVLGLIDLRLSTSGSLCQQNLKVIDGETTNVFDCADNNYLKYTQRYVSVTSSVYVTLTVTSPTPESFIWIDLSGDRMAVYCGVSEAFTPPQELDCPTTTLSTTTEPTTTESASGTQPKPEPTPGSTTESASPESTTEETTESQSTAQPAPTDSQTSGPSAVAIAGLSFGIAGTVGSFFALLFLCRFIKNVRSTHPEAPKKMEDTKENALTQQEEKRHVNGQAPLSTSSTASTTTSSMPIPKPPLEPKKSKNALTQQEEKRHVNGQPPLSTSSTTSTTTSSMPIPKPPLEPKKSKDGMLGLLPDDLERPDVRDILQSSA